MDDMNRIQLNSLTLYWAEAPALVLSVIMSSGAPVKAIFPAHTGAAVEPLAIIQEGEVTWAAVRVSLDGVDFYEKEETERHGNPNSRKHS